jgi:SNF2 family DNA or RNA helicase
VPFGVAQQSMHRRWLHKFPAFFSHLYPHHRFVEAGLVRKYAPALGQLWKLEFAATLPEADPDLDWIINEPEGEPLRGVSNWTPKNLKVLEIISEQVRKGEKVLVGSDLIETGRWLCSRLTERGIRAVNIVEASKRSGRYATKNPRARAKAVTEFVVGEAQVLCVGVNAMRLGHNLDVASSVVLAGLPWDHATLVQFEGRVWRLTSKKPVSVFVVLTKESLDERKWQLLQDKGAAADVALDGQLIDEPEPPIDWGEIIKEMIEDGVKVNGDEIPEAQPLATPIDPARHPRKFQPIKPLKSSEQLALFS